jgi:hypothetical protein
MQKSIIVLYVLVLLSLIFSLATFLILAHSNFFAPANPINSPTPYGTSPPITNNPTPPITIKPTSTPTPTSFTVSYIETNRESVAGDRTKVALTVNIGYRGGNSVTIDYSQFYLQLYAPRMTIFMYEGTVAPQNSGSFSIGASHQTASFQLTFSYPSGTFNGMDPAKTYYQLKYNGTATVQWLNQDYH